MIHHLTVVNSPHPGWGAANAFAARWRLLRRALAPLLLAACAATRVEDPPAPECPTVRQTSDGSCCEPWTRADGATCVARSFSVPRALGSSGSGMNDPVVAIDGLGRPHFAWARGSTTFHAVESEGAFEIHEGPVLPGFSRQVDLAAGPRGEAVVVFRQGGFLGQTDQDGAVFTLRFDPDGAAVGDDPPLSEGVNAYEPRVAIGPSGDLVIVWNQWTGEHFGVGHASADRAEDALSIAADEATVLSQPFFYSNAPRPVVNADGHALVTWYQAIDGPLLVFVSERSGDGPFTRPEPDAPLSPPGLPVAGNGPFNPTPALAEDGRAAVLWMQETGDGHTGAFWALRDADGAWTRPRSLDDALGPKDGATCCGEVAMNRAGDTVAVWTQDNTIVAVTRTRDGAVEPVRLVSTPGALALDASVSFGEGDAGVLVYRERLRDDGLFRTVLHPVVGTEIGAPRVLSEEVAVDVFQPVAAISGPDDACVVAWREGGLAGNGGELRFVTLER
jgi:hypothetical protein